MNLKLIPNDEIISKFLKTNFEDVTGTLAIAGSKDII